MVGEYNKKLTDVLGEVTNRKWGEFSTPPEARRNQADKNTNQPDDIDYDNSAVYPDIEPVDDADGYYANPSILQEDDVGDMVEPLIEPPVHPQDELSPVDDEESEGDEQDVNFDQSDNQALKDALGEDFDDITFDEIEDEDQDASDADGPDPIDALDDEGSGHIYDHDEAYDQVEVGGHMEDDPAEFDAGNVNDNSDDQYSPEAPVQPAMPVDAKKPGFGLPIYLLLVVVILSGLTYLGYVTYNLFAGSDLPSTSATERASAQQQDVSSPAVDDQKDTPESSADSRASDDISSDDGFIIANIDRVAEPPTDLVVRMQKDRERAINESGGDLSVVDEPIDVVAALGAVPQAQPTESSVQPDVEKSSNAEGLAAPGAVLDDANIPPESNASVTIRPDEKIEQAFADLDQNDSALAKEAFMDGVNEAFGEVDSVSLRVAIVEEKITRIEEVLTRASEQFQLAEQQIAELSSKIVQYQSVDTEKDQAPPKAQPETNPDQPKSSADVPEYIIGDVTNNSVEITYKGQTQTYTIGSPIPDAGLLVSINAQSKQVRTTTGLIGN